jgi:RHS repeat-associated protein
MQERLGSGHVSDSGKGPLEALCRAADPLEVSIDPNGNLTSKTEGTDTWTYTWNAENQLTKVEKNSIEHARFSCDPLGRRVEKIAGGVTTTYTYNAWDIVRETDTTGARITYAHGWDIDEPLTREDAGSVTYYHRDGTGSVVKATGATGAVVLGRQYDAWGKLESGAEEPGYAFTSREWDPETGLYYYRARYYDPRSGRFVSEDPIRWSGGIDFYAYVMDNPVRFGDAFGLMVYECHRGKRPFVKSSAIPHGLLWSTVCNKSYSFGPEHWWGMTSGPGHIDPNDNPFDPNGKTKPGYQCTAHPGECFEVCVCEFITHHEANPPWYQAFGGDNQCTDAKNRVVVACEAQCLGKK